MLPGWEEPGYFSETDRAALRLTEAVTWLATVMNAFNRAAITSRYHVAA